MTGTAKEIPMIFFFIVDGKANMHDTMVMTSKIPVHCLIIINEKLENISWFDLTIASNPKMFSKKCNVCVVDSMLKKGIDASKYIDRK
ncbi:MAG: hypothetical protein V1900_04110 [Candidatus Aenigmatarchaeota archaeon]